MLNASGLSLRSMFSAASWDECLGAPIRDSGVIVKCCRGQCLETVSMIGISTLSYFATTLVRLTPEDGTDGCGLIDSHLRSGNLSTHPLRRQQHVSLGTC